MSLWDLTPCAREHCGHARHYHRTRDTKAGKARIHCSRCACPEYVEPPLISEAAARRAEAAA